MADGKTSLKYKLVNYRSRLGCPEVMINSLKHKPAGKSCTAYGVKKTKRTESELVLHIPSGETGESLEDMRKALLSDVKKRNRDSEVQNGEDVCIQET